MGILLHGCRHHAACDDLHAIRQQGVVQQLVFLAQLAHGADVGLAGFDYGRFRGYEHQLAATGGTGGAACHQCRDDDECAG